MKRTRKSLAEDSITQRWSSILKRERERERERDRERSKNA